LYAYKSDGDPHDEIVHLEAHIEELAAKIESCRKFILASRIAIVGPIGEVPVFKARYWLSFAVDERTFEDYCAGSI
jgi:hypothetical protein